VGDSQIETGNNTTEDITVGKSRKNGGGGGVQERRRGFKRTLRDHDSRENVDSKGSEKERKRGADDMEVDVEEEEREKGRRSKIQKKGVNDAKRSMNDVKAGLSEQPCANQ
jgi:hypothetical protein